MLSVTDANFKEVLGAHLAIVDFWSPMCSHCMDMKPVVEELAKEKNDSILIVGADVDKAKKTSDKYNVEGLPTLIFFRDGVEVHRTEGSMPKKELLKQIKKAFGD